MLAWSYPRPLCIHLLHCCPMTAQEVAVKVISREECSDFNLVSREVHSHRILVHREFCVRTTLVVVGEKQGSRVGA